MQLTAVIRSYMESTQITREQCKIAWTFEYRTDDLVKEANPVPGYFQSEAELRTMQILGIEI